LRHRLRHGEPRGQGHGGDRRTDDRVVLHPGEQRPGRSHRRRLISGDHPGDDLEHPPVPGAGGHPMSAVDAVRVVPGTETRERAGGPTGGGGWFVRIMILVVVVIWIIPTVGVLISSFRPPDLVESTGWWTVFAHPFRLAEWTLQNYRSARSTGGFRNAFRY